MVEWLSFGLGELPLGGSQVLRFHENALINLVKAVRWYLDYDAVMPELVSRRCNAYLDSFDYDLYDLLDEYISVVYVMLV